MPTYQDKNQLVVKSVQYKNIVTKELFELLKNKKELYFFNECGILFIYNESNLAEPVLYDEYITLLPNGLLKIIPQLEFESNHCLMEVG